MNEVIEVLGKREQFRDHYWLNRDPILKDRLLWRAQSFRHLIHLLPGQSILELGCGQGLLTPKLVQVSRGENPITSVTFLEALPQTPEESDNVEFMSLANSTEQLEGREFDFIIAMDLLDKSNCSWLLQQAYKLLKPGGEIIFYESNPWNPFLRINRVVSGLLGKKDQRRLISRPDLYELISEIGFVRVFSVFNDFAYAPLTANGSWFLQNMSILLENMPFVRTLAGSILLHAQKPPRTVPLPTVSLCDHPELYNAVSVVVPCHNEEMNLRPLVSRLLDLYGDYLYEIVLVDDNSRDNTKQVITELAEQYPLITPVFRTPPNGVGRAIMDGYRAATGKYILSMDCDFQHLLPDLRDIFDGAAEGYDVVIGSRFSRRSVLLNYPFQKIAANRGFHFLARIILRTKFRDVTNNLKLLRREVVEKMELTQPGFSINAETGLLPILMGFTFKEVPISWINRTPDMGVSSFKLVKVGGGYWQVLYRLWMKKMFKNKEYYSATTLGKSKGLVAEKATL
ncbi:glycosyltransferase [Hymenobacter sp. BT491]|uniref:glycosyltransferase n=1 Tax=Hymenobacter sp. BT491 TaxID=2766779 RepID=UPI0016535D0F|nr:glycosyltransferase [Hymenobacter sp. BT491]MBC6989897.1 glycosyltransferase [Hymenobacter sp. BT491]